MRLLLLLALCLPITPAALAADEPTTEGVQVAPVRVLAHSLDVRSNGKKTTVKQRWSIRIEDAEAVAAGIAAPPGMDGATDGEARVLGDLAVFPPGLAAGDTFTFVHETEMGPYASGSFAPVADVEAEKVTANLDVRGAPVTVWADPSASVHVDEGRGRISWGAGTATDRQLVWSTWPSWDAAGADVHSSVEDRLASAGSLGRDMASHLTGLRPRAIAERVYERVELDHGAMPWSESRGSAEIARSGRGTATERGLVLINLLQVAGFDAVPALYAPADARADAPMSLVAPHLYTKPAVVVRTEDGPIVLDPANPLVVPPTLPQAVRGGRIWAQGDAPRDVTGDGLFSGTVSIVGRLVIGEGGSASWHVTITARNSAAETLRSRLGALSEEERKSLLLRLSQVAFPELNRFSTESTGLRALDRPIRIQLNAFVPQTLEPLGPGLEGRVHPLLAPAMAAWLPGGIEVIEQLGVRRPKHVLPLSVQVTESRHADEASLTTTLAVEGENLMLLSRASRPDTSHRPSAEAHAEKLLHARAGEGAVALFFPWPNAEVTKVLRDGVEGLTPVETHALEALAWWREPEDRKARKALGRAMDLGSVDEIAAAFVRFGDPNNSLPWEALLDEATPTDRMICARGIAAQGQWDLAWRKAMPLASHADPGVQLQAKLLMARTQPIERPDEEADREGYIGWRDAIELFEEIRTLATSQGDEEALALALETLAEFALESGQLDLSQSTLDERMALGESPAVYAMLTEVLARQGASPGAIHRALEAAETLDEHGILHASHALSIAEDPHGALSWARVAARLDPQDPERWDLVTDAALGVGDLAIAVQAARLSSDAVPQDRDRAARLSHLASLAWDRALAQEAAKRAGLKASTIPWGEDLDGLTAMAKEEELRAVLVFHDETTAGSAVHLQVRGELALDAGDAASAARDGALLTTRHGSPHGPVLSFAASVGHVYGDAPLEALDDVIDESIAARRARMEYALVTGRTDPLADAKLIKDTDPMAAQIMDLARGKAPDGWAGGPDPALTASGFEANKALGRSGGVTAVSDPSRALGIVRHTGPELLPPPLALLYTPRERALLEREDGVAVTRLDGGLLPVHVAWRTTEGVTTLGVGFTPEAAQRAFDSAP